MRTAVVCLLVSVMLLGGNANAQVRITGGISGAVIDGTGAIMPGATVTLKDEGTGTTKESVTNESGLFSFPDLSHGTYQITVTLTGFQTAIFNKVSVDAGRTTDLRVSMKVGNLEEAITVEGATPVLERTSNMVSSTLSMKAINEMPLAGRDVFTLARLVPGAASPQGSSVHYNGMPGGTINPTIDGINNSSNGFKSGGTSFFGTVPARLGAIEEVTVETSGQGAESGAMGGVNLKFITRRGTNQFKGSLFEQHRNEFFNANSFTNNARNIPKDRLRRNDFGGNIGGPLLPGTSLRDKVFLFVNYEQESIPQTQTRTRTVLRPVTEAGVFTYQTATGEQRQVNLLNIARDNRFPSTIDPTIGTMLTGHREARQYGTVNSTNSLLTEELSWREPQEQTNFFPTARMDVQITRNLSWMGSWNLYRQDTSGRRGWPLPGYPPQLDTQKRAWWITSTGLNWAIAPNVHNEFRYGVQHSGDTIPYREAKYYEQLNGVLNGLPARFPNDIGLGLAPLANDGAPITGRHYITTLTDSLTMMRGSHTYEFGGQFRLSHWRDTSLDGPGSAGFLGLPQYTLGLPTGDPAQGIFNTTSMPGVQNADLANARTLYAILVGRVASVTTGRILDPDTLEYSDKIYRENWTASRMGGFYAQDQWRLRTNFTLNYGLRYELSGAPYSNLGNANFPDEANLFGPSTALFQPGQLNGVQNPVITRGKHAVKLDRNNFAPNVGFAWTPMSKGGWLERLLGTGSESVVRGAYSITYYDEGTNFFASNAGNNPGLGQSLRLQPGIGFEPGALMLQTPLPAFVAFPERYQEVFPQSDFTFSNGFRTLKNDLQTPYVHSWNIGFQRQIFKNTVFEARYTGTRGEDVWRTINLNEVNVFENGFLDEFKRAQTNLTINRAQGVESFQNLNRPGQFALPIMDTAFGARGSQPALPAASGYTNGGFITNLDQRTVGALANSLGGNSNYACRMFGNTFSPCTRLGYNAAGTYPINFWYLNPFAGSQGAFLVEDESKTRYHALQLQLRRRYWQGLQMNVNYTLGKSTGDIWLESAIQDINYRTLRDRSADFTTAHYDVRHVLQAFGTYDLPFGNGRHWDVKNPVLNAAVGGWTIGGTFTAQSGSPFRLTSGRQTFNQFTNDGIVLVNGTTVEDLQKAIQISQGPGINRYWIDPKYIGPDGRANPQYITVPTTPGELGQQVMLRGKASWVFDGSLNKFFDLPGRAVFGVHVTVTNVFNHPIWSTPSWNTTAAPAVPNITSTTFGQIAAPLNGARQMYLRGEVRF
jgi:carboxypeptidase family protein